MKNLSTILCALALLGAVMVVPVSAADNWTAEQKEVWAAEEKMWELMTQDNLDGFLALIHNDYVGWQYEAPVPYGKETSAKWIKYWVPQRKVLIYDLSPVAIAVFGNFAIVDYYYQMVVEIGKDDEKKKKESEGRWTDIFMKEGGKWMLVGDHGGSTDDDDDDD
ncbi:nuclear transport factor 2 family protein [bacterium]|nr:nuclear transport factor 2 family protein [bacterium]MBU1985309.1 nuclear transport factor 2 family protein [bacterium]